MQELSKFRRCHVFVIQPRERHSLDTSSLLSGGPAIKVEVYWVVLAPHLGVEVEVDAEEIGALGRLDTSKWLTYAEATKLVPAPVFQGLCDKGLIVSDANVDERNLRRDQGLRDQHWWSTAAIAHYFQRWRQVGVGENGKPPRPDAAELVRRNGLPPTHAKEVCPPGERLPLPQPRRTLIDDLLEKRVTCRNFDTGSALDLQTCSDILKRVFGCSSITDALPGVRVVKKFNPSGGGLHPVEAYVLAHRVQGIAPGLYHYHVPSHTLEPMSTMDVDSARTLAECFVSGQEYFADAPIQVVLTARFFRSFWKYWNHAKAYRAIILEIGHISQNLYIAATEKGLGAFITAAINEIDIEKTLGLDDLVEGALAVVGFGKRAEHKITIEFDPLGAVWREQDSPTGPDNLSP